MTPTSTAPDLSAEPPLVVADGAMASLSVARGESGRRYSSRASRPPATVMDSTTTSTGINHR
ncbi:hypothetical protein [Amycolatopsis sp. M39]|uniref:hypothetical protein n=1 Tax=Amycolatopsis sp. M39 TaxID=1825094 RepID=UPI001E3BE330|nr:hypothetical protein [Amycolatopsis sp. M39]